MLHGKCGPLVNFRFLVALFPPLSKTFYSLIPPLTLIPCLLQNFLHASFVRSCGQKPSFKRKISVVVHGFKGFFIAGFLILLFSQIFHNVDRAIFGTFPAFICSITFLFLSVVQRIKKPLKKTLSLKLAFLFGILLLSDTRFFLWA